MTPLHKEATASWHVTATWTEIYNVLSAAWGLIPKGKLSSCRCRMSNSTQFIISATYPVDIYGVPVDIDDTVPPYTAIIEEVPDSEHRRRGRGDRSRSHHGTSTGTGSAYANGGPIGTVPNQGTSTGVTKILHNGEEGWWCWAPLGTPLPAMTVKDGIFVDQWPREWKPFTNGNPEPLRLGYDTSIAAAVTLPVISGYTPPPELEGVAHVMIGWHSACGTVRVIAEDVRLGALVGRCNPLAALRIFTVGPVGGVYTQTLAGTPPEHAGAYRGWRKWKVDADTLTLQPLVHSGGGFRWQPGWNHDPAYSTHRGEPGGLYACTTAEQLVTQDTTGIPLWIQGYHILGSMLGAGRIRTARHGFRASIGKPEMIIFTGKIDTDLLLLSLADKYGMGTVDSLGAAMDIPTGLIEHHEPVWPPEAAT